MVRKSGQKFRVGEVKSEIITYLLKNEETISEPNIRKHLEEKFGIKNQGTINTHLQRLSELKCIESVDMKTRSNFWGITKLTNLKNIRREFPDIGLNSYEKSIMIVFNEHGYSLDKLGNLDFYIKLLLSVSLFDAFLDNNMDELLKISRRIYLREEGLGKKRKIETHMKNFVDLYEKANPGFKFQDPIETDTRNISKEDFVKGFEDKYHGLTDEMIRDLEDVYTIVKEVNSELEKKESQILFKHFLDHDTFKEIESPDEYNFLIDLQECRSRAANIWDEEGNLKNIDRFIELLRLEELKVYSEIIVKYKQPSLFAEISDSPQEIFEILKDYYKEVISKAEECQ